MHQPHRQPAGLEPPVAASRPATSTTIRSTRPGRVCFPVAPGTRGDWFRPSPRLGPCIKAENHLIREHRRIPAGHFERCRRRRTVTADARRTGGRFSDSPRHSSELHDPLPDSSVRSGDLVHDGAGRRDGCEVRVALRPPPSTGMTVGERRESSDMASTHYWSRESHRGPNGELADPLERAIDAVVHGILSIAEAAGRVGVRRSALLISNETVRPFRRRHREFRTGIPRHLHPRADKPTVSTVSATLETGTTARIDERWPTGREVSENAIGRWPSETAD